MNYLYLIPLCFVLISVCHCGNDESDPSPPEPGPKKSRTNSILQLANSARVNSMDSLHRAGSGLVRKLTRKATDIVKIAVKAIKKIKFEDQVGGHPDDIFVIAEDIVDESGRVLIPAGALGKNANDYEKLAVPKVRADPHLVGLVPLYYEVVEVPDGVDEDGLPKTKTIFGMENLLRDYDHDSGVLIDIKFCWRSFLTNDPDDNDKDWMNKFIEFGLVESKHKGKCEKGCKDPHRPTKKVQAILDEMKKEGIDIPFPEKRTKIEGQKLKDQLNSQYHFGFRITATKLRKQKKSEQKKLQEQYNFLRKEEDVLAVLVKLLGECHITNPEKNPGNKTSRQLLVEKLEEALPRLMLSAFFAHNETPGSSGSIVCDKNHMDLRFIDWGKSVELDPKHVDHVGMWIPGQQPKGDRADGYFTGVQNLTKLLKDGWIKNPPKK
ncbi:inositol-trisphosphate 3-kinase like protein [Ditylenchus destructor]|uniref:Kinase n=1 Tax=Ditylenchus destructor TaxID=166010 RepID=A0AAD4MV87_9BILA|nr:inositol-trisphosphate 3-kinase like protein [Ditylenchus destructor]